MTKESKRELYKAVKYQVAMFPADCGFAMHELWAVVTGRTNKFDMMFWKNTVLSDYAERRR